MTLTPDFSMMQDVDITDCRLFYVTVSWSENNEELRQDYMICANTAEDAKAIARNRAPYKLTKGVNKSNHVITITAKDYGRPSANKTYYASPVLDNGRPVFKPNIHTRRRIIENPEEYYQELFSQRLEQEIAKTIQSSTILQSDENTNATETKIEQTDEHHIDNFNENELPDFNYQEEELTNFSKEDLLEIIEIESLITSTYLQQLQKLTSSQTKPAEKYALSKLQDYLVSCDLTNHLLTHARNYLHVQQFIQKTPEAQSLDMQSFCQKTIQNDLQNACQKHHQNKNQEETS